MYVGNFAGALEALDAGVTTILDFSHCNNTPEHADRAIEGLLDAGIRATFAYGYFAPPRAEPHFTSHDMRLEDSRRVQRELEALPGDLITMGISLTEPGLIPFEDTRREVETARELGVVIATHTACIWGMPSGLDQFAHCGLLGPDIVHVHCNACTERDWTLLRAPTRKISVTPETEMQMGMGHPPIRQAIERASSSASAATSSPRTPATCSARCASACRTRARSTTTASTAAEPTRPSCPSPRATRFSGRPSTAPGRSASTIASAR